MRVSWVVVSLVVAALFQAGCETYPPSGSKSSESWKKPASSTKPASSSAYSKPSTTATSSSNTVARSTTLPTRASPVPVAPAPVASSAATDVSASPNISVASAKAAPAAGAKAAPTASASDVSGATVANSNFVRRVHLQFKDKKTEKEFLQLVAGKQAVQKKIYSIAVLRAEQVATLQQVSKKLADDFQIRPDGSYRYDTQTMTIYEVVSEARGTNAATGKVHLQIKEKEKERQFVLLLAAKKKTLEAIASMDFMLQEKRQALGVYDTRLNAAYSISKDRNYQYDASTQTLYELIPAPGKAGVVGGAQP